MGHWVSVSLGFIVAYDRVIFTGNIILTSVLPLHAKHLLLYVVFIPKIL